MAPANSVVRPEVQRLLAGAADHRVTVISAGPGWGKTTAAAQWLASRQHPPGSPDSTDLPVAWLTLAPALDSPAPFWDGVLRGLLACGAVPEGHPLSALSPSDGVSDEVRQLLHAGLSTLPGRVLLVLDDFQVIENSDVLDHLTTMISRPSRLSVMLLTRIQPLLPLHQLRLTGELLEVSSSDLAFGAADVAAVARTQGLELAASEIAAVLERTEGWPAGVRLAALYLSRTGNRDGIERFAGTERSVAQYLLAEVLGRNTAEDREFLLRSSVCDPISGELAGALVPGRNGRAVLEVLESRNEFVTALGPDRQWFHYHPLLRNLLEHTLRRDDPAANRDAHRRAADWLANHGEPISALRHAAAAADWSLFADVYCTAAGPALVGRQRAELAALLADVPFQDLPDGLAVEMMRGGLAFVEGRLDAIGAHLELARDQLRPSATGVDVAARVLLELLTLASGWAIGDVAGIAAASRRAIAAIDSADPFPAATGYRAVAQINLGIAAYWSGDIPGARATFASILDREGAAVVGLSTLHARAHLAHAELIEARLGSAATAATEVMATAAACGWTTRGQTRPAHLALAWTLLLQGDESGADRALAAAAATDDHEQVTAAALPIAQALVAVSRRRPQAAERAARMARELTLDRNQPPFLSDELDRMLADVAILTGEPSASATNHAAGHDSPTRVASRARLLLAAGDARGARTLADAVTSAGRSTTIADLVALIEAWLVSALAADLAGHALGASNALCRAVDIAGPQHLVRPFLVTGSARTQVLLRRVADGQVRRDPFLVELVERTSAPPQGGPEPAPLLEALTGREMAMLAELPTMKSNAEIAAAYFVSVNTVKTHLKGLYRKLDVDSRRAAVHRARELGLLP